MLEASDKPIALIDCNNFYASCERLFQPELAAKAIVVLSNNEASVIGPSPSSLVLCLSAS